jgi:hypothetical protein
LTRTDCRCWHGASNPATRTTTAARCAPSSASTGTSPPTPSRPDDRRPEHPPPFRDGPVHPHPGRHPVVCSWRQNGFPPGVSAPPTGPRLPGHTTAPLPWGLAHTRHGNLEGTARSALTHRLSGRTQNGVRRRATRPQHHPARRCLPPVEHQPIQSASAPAPRRQRLITEAPARSGRLVGGRRAHPRTGARNPAGHPAPRGRASKAREPHPHPQRRTSMLRPMLFS